MRARFSQIFDPASSQTVVISDLFKVVLIICAVILLIVASMIGISLIRFRHRPGTRSIHVFSSSVEKQEMLVTVATVDRKVFKVKFRSRQTLNGAFSFGAGFENCDGCLVFCHIFGFIQF